MSDQTYELVIDWRDIPTISKDNLTAELTVPLPTGLPLHLYLNDGILEAEHGDSPLHEVAHWHTRSFFERHRIALRLSHVPAGAAAFNRQYIIDHYPPLPLPGDPDPTPGTPWWPEEVGSDDETLWKGNRHDAT